MARSLIDPWDNAIPESAIVLGIYWAAHDEPVYREGTPWQVPSIIYGPLTYHVPAWVGEALGLTDLFSLRRIARLWTLFCTLLTALVIYDVTRTLRLRERRRSTFFWPLIAAMFSLIFVPMPEWSVTSRCDAPFLLTNVLTIRLLMAFDDRDRPPGWALVTLGAMILLSASFRQIVLGPPMTIVLWLVSRGQWRTMILFVLAVPVAGAGLLLLGHATIPHLVENIIRGGAIPYNLTNMRGQYHQVLPHLIFLGVLAVEWCSHVWRGHRPPAFSIYPFAAFPFAFLLAGKQGSATTYYWETLVTLTPAAVLTLETQAKVVFKLFRYGLLHATPPHTAVIAAGVLIGSIYLGAEAGNYLKGLPGEPRVTVEEFRHDLETIRRLQREEGEVVFLPLHWAALLTDSPFITIDLYLHWTMTFVGRASLADVHEKILEVDGPLAVDPKVFVWPEYRSFAEIVRENFVEDHSVSRRLETFSIWRPAEPQESDSASAGN